MYLLRFNSLGMRRTICAKDDLPGVRKQDRRASRFTPLVSKMPAVAAGISNQRLGTILTE
jgi:hypothetical protein